MTAPDKCPYCGADVHAKSRTRISFDCHLLMEVDGLGVKWGVAPDISGQSRPSTCYERQIERLKTALTGVLDTLSAHDAIAYDCDRSGNTYCDCIERVTKKAREALNPGGAS